MASLAGSALSLAMPVKAINIKSVSFSGLRKDNVTFCLQPVPQRFAVCCPAKKETVDQVCDIVKKQLALADGTEVCGSSKFQDLGADSLDTVNCYGPRGSFWDQCGGVERAVNCNRGRCC
ncbi:hypothetical protein PVAP13_2KG386300 [Panicum virgatum]|uniref:Carrier domain-containing protein n=1 Tax=Panicum virgatum TaxID=38727 RepID=A0A8T0WFG6_PANVG|nr:hypothetical protein PVAP13_2KG386300 [Panicum virgatum]